MSKNIPKKNKAKNTNTPKISKQDAVYSIFVFIAVCALIFYPPYVRGMFFNEDFFLYYILTAIVFMLVLIDKISRKDFEILSTPLDWAVAAYTGAYLLSLIGAVHPGEAFYGFLKALNYFMVYWMVSQMVRTYTSYERLLQVLLASGMGVALIGILAAAGYSDYPSAFDGQLIMSTLQYKNAAAVFLLVITILGTTLWVKENHKWIRPVYSLANYLMILVILGTMSKGGWLVLAIGAVVLVIGMPGQYRLKAVYSLAMSGLAAVIAALQFLPAVTGDNAAHALAYLLLGIAVLIGGELLWNFWSFSSQRWGKAAVIGGAAVLFIALGTFTMFSLDHGTDIHDKLVSSTVVGQAQNIGNLSDFSYTSRLDIYRWGIAMAKDNLLFGNGAGAWNALYHKYQDYLFFTTEVHNHYLQVLIEAGLLGLLAFLAMWVMLIITIYKQKQKYIQENQEAEEAVNQNSWLLIWGVAVAALMAGLHAFIDFDLSLGAICILLWTLLGLINAGSRIEKLYPAGKTNIWIFLVVGIILFLAPLISGQRMLAASNLYKGATGLLNQTLSMENGTDKEAKLNNVAAMAAESGRYDPCNANYPALLAQASSIQYQLLIQQQKPESKEKLAIIHEAMKTTEKLAPNDIKVRSAMINACIQIQDIPEAMQQAKFVLETNPLDANVYSAIINIAMVAADNSLKQKDNQTALKYLHMVIEYADKMEARKSKMDPQKMQLPFWSGAPFVLNQEAQFALGKAYYMTGNYPRAQEVLQPLLGAQMKPELQVQAWCLAAMYKTGASPETQAGIQALRTSDPESAAVFDNLIQMTPLDQR